MSGNIRAYTSARVTERGVLLFEQHLERLASAGEPYLSAFRAFARTATLGHYSLRAIDNQLVIQNRPPSVLVDGMPVRFHVSPFAEQRGAFAKPAPPSFYDAVRIPGVATLLTSADGSELYESCVAAVIAWDGARLLAPPEDRPLVRSTARGALQRAGLLSFAPLRADGNEPLALLSSLALICSPAVPGREPFPAQARQRVLDALEATARRD